MKPLLNTFFLFLFLCLTTCSSAHTVSPITAQTFYKASNAPLWFSTSTLPFSYNSKPATASIQSGLSLEGFYWKSAAAGTLGNYFGFYDAGSGTVCPYIRVTADLTKPHCLIPQDIVHNSGNATDPFNPATNPLQALITFNPSIEQYGFIMTNSLRIHEWITIHTIVPWIHTNHLMGLITKSTTNITIENNSRGVIDFFTGNLKQVATASPDQQDPLQYGKLADSQSINGIADITLLCLLAPNISEDVTVQCGVLAVLPTTSRPQGIFLFEPTLGTGGHPLFGIYGSAQADFFALRGIVIGGFIDASLRAGIGTQEVRSPSYTVGGSDAEYERYSLGGKQNARRLFPLINILTQVVNVTPGTAFEINLGLSARYKRMSGGVGYRYTRTGKETVSPMISWPDNTYAQSDLSYAQVTTIGGVTTYNAFDVAAHSAFMNNAPLMGSEIDFFAAATPAQSTNTFSFSLGCIPLPTFPYSSLQVRGYYSFTGSTTFGIGGYGLTVAASHTF